MKEAWCLASSRTELGRLADYEAKTACDHRASLELIALVFGA